MKQVEITSKIIGRGGSTTSASPSLDLSGYALISDLLNYVTINGNEDVTGLHDFVNGLKIGGIELIQKNGNAFLKGSLVVEGGITMYGDGEGGSSVPSYSTLGSLLNVDESNDAVASVDRVLFQSAGSNVWSWKALSEIGGGSSGGSVSGDYLPLSGGTINGNSGLDLIINTSYSEYNLIGFKQNNTYRGYVGVEADGKIGMYSYVSRSFFGINSSGEPFVQNDKINQIYNILHAGNYSSYALPLSGGTLNGSLLLQANPSEWLFNAQTNTSIFCASHTDNYGIFAAVNTSDPSHYILKLTYNDNTLSGRGSHAMTVYADGKVVIGDISSNYILSVGGDIYTKDWVCSHGWYNDQYYGGWYMIDQDFIRTYNGKMVYLEEGGTSYNTYGIGTHCLNLLIGGSGAPHSSILLRSNTTGWGIASNSDGNMYIGRRPNASHLANQNDVYILQLSPSGLLSYGGITMYSDQRKKTILNHVELSLKQIADAPLIEHYYNSDTNKTTHVGSIAQYWAGLNDWFCKLDNEGFYTMEIQNAALASAISIARHLERYESKTDKTIRKMKQRIQELEDEVERLKKGA